MDSGSKLARGCIVAGVQPRSDPLFAEVDPEAVAEIGPGADPRALAQLRAAVRGWTPGRARRIHEMALRRFDWRWRLRGIAGRMDLPRAALDAEIAMIGDRLSRADGPRPRHSVG